MAIHSTFQFYETLRKSTDRGDKIFVPDTGWIKFKRNRVNEHFWGYVILL